MSRSKAAAPQPDWTSKTLAGLLLGIKTLVSPEAGAELLRESRREVAEWTWEMPTPTYLELLGTTSQYRVAEPRVRADLETGLSGILGRSVLLDVQTLLVETVRA